jgi:hypothetical protein
LPAATRLNRDREQYLRTTNSRRKKTDRGKTYFSIGEGEGLFYCYDTTNQIACKMNARNWTSLLLALSGWILAFPAAADIQYAGVNLSGAEFGSAGGNSALPGTYNNQYIYPNSGEVNYYLSKGMNIIRLPFRWERLQHTNNVALDATELSRMNTFVSTATSKGMFVILDPHNFERYYPDISSFGTMQSGSVGLVGSAIPDSTYTNF